MSTIGGEIGQLRGLKTTFDREAQAVQELTARIRGELNNTWWKGPAAERFRGAWGSDFEPALRRLQAALQDAAGEVNRRTEALIQAGS
ncbi:MAG: WXG100 family type VII secretion target [Actinomycetota bacterium]|nr:WXG100 family type VII secretion target [Actinomycetota bacterium]